MVDPQALVGDLWRRILAGEDPAEVLADMRRRDAERRAQFEADLRRLALAVAVAESALARRAGRLH